MSISIYVYLIFEKRTFIVRKFTTAAAVDKTTDNYTIVKAFKRCRSVTGRTDQTMGMCECAAATNRRTSAEARRALKWCRGRGAGAGGGAELGDGWSTRSLTGSKGGGCRGTDQQVYDWVYRHRHTFAPADAITEWRM